MLILSACKHHVKASFFVMVSIILLSTQACHNTPILKQNIFKADLDTVYNNGSRITSIPLDSDKIHILTNLGMLWGFLKYYHAAVNKGEFNMDAELFRVLPKALSANNNDEANKVLEQWTDHLGVPDTCKDCREIIKTDRTKLMPDYGYLFDKDNLPQTLISKLEFIKRNRFQDSDHYYIGIWGSPIFKHEIAYDDKQYPDAGLRLLALYRYWNMIQYFFPDRHLIGEDWNKVLADFIPTYCNAGDTLAYELACVQLIGCIHDTHANLWGGHATIDSMKGSYTVPFRAKFIEDKLVVTGYYDDSFPVKYKVQIGDIIEKINGITVDSLIKKYLPITPASNYSTQLRNLAKASGFLLEGKTPDMSLQLLRTGQLHDVNVQRSRNKMHDDGLAQPKLFTVMAGNIGYIYPACLYSMDLDSIKIKFKDTKGIIIDMRCYPNVYMPYTYGEWLKPIKSPFAYYTIMNVDIPGLFGITEPVFNGSDTGIHYQGKLVIIVNEETQSQAEFTTMAFSTIPGAKVIGSTTAGADGGVSSIVLPGGRTTMFSGIGVLYPDGTETQRTGVKIDKVVKPTIKGIKERRDEPLEYAIKLINGK